MRSFLFCFVFLFNIPNSAATHDFCLNPPPSCPEPPCDCNNMKIQDKNDNFEWKLDNSFDNRKVVTQEGTHITLDMHRALFIEKTNEVLNLKFESLKGTCKVLLYRTDDLYSLKKENEITVIIPIAKNKKVVFAVVDPECELTIERSLFKGSILYHVFLNNQDTTKFNEVLFDKNKKRELGTYISASQKSAIEQNIPKDVRKYNSIFQFDNDLYNDENKMKECLHKCTYGSIIKFQLIPNVNFANTFRLKETCKWMTVHIRDDKLYRTAEISLRHGFVTLPHELKAYPINFEKAEPASMDYEVTVAYYAEKKENEDKYHSHMMIANIHGRSVHTTKLEDSTANIAFAFSHEDCLIEPIGGFDINKNEDDNLKAFPFKENMNLGFRAATVETYKAFRYAHNTGDTGINYEDRAGITKTREGGTKDDTQAPVKFEEAQIITTTTAKPIDSSATLPTEAPAPSSVYTEDDAKKWEELNQKKKQQIEADLNSITYRTWAIPAGFAAGSFSSFVIGNIILFIFKRTVMNFWYKAMYKRYGSDTTMGAGTTMGKTMGGETIGGSTTVGGGTTMGSTTAGETVGSTTAA